MEQHQDFAVAAQSSNRSSDQPAAEHWVVTYLDTDCGRVRTETFDDALAAERFASRRVQDEHGWAVVDAVRPRQSRAAA